jgi:hypothetical protein
MKKSFMALFLRLLFLGLFAFNPVMAVGQDSVSITKEGSITTYSISETDILKIQNVVLKPDSVVINYWGTIGGSLAGGFGEVNLGINKNLFSAHYFTYRKFELNFFSEEAPEPAYNELGLLFGRILTSSKRRFYFSVSAGISRIAITKWKVISVETRELLFSPYTYVEYDDYETVTIGYPIKCKIMYRGKYFGIGLDFIANMNPATDLAFGVPHLSFGKLK